MSTTGPIEVGRTRRTSVDEVIALRAFLQNGIPPFEPIDEAVQRCDSIVDAIGDDLAALRATNLRLQDKIDDIMHGLEFWKQHKVANAESTTMDEMLMRWVEAALPAEASDNG